MVRDMIENDIKTLPSYTVNNLAKLYGFSRATLDRKRKLTNEVPQPDIGKESGRPIWYRATLIKEVPYLFG